MCDIVIAILVSTKIAKLMKEKGRSSAGYVILFLGMFFGGEITGIVIGVLLSYAAMNPAGSSSGLDFLPVVFAILGAAVGGITAYAIANSMPAIERRRWAEFDEPEQRRPFPDLRTDPLARDESIQDRPRFGSAHDRRD